MEEECVALPSLGVPGDLSLVPDEVRVTAHFNGALDEGLEGRPVSGHHEAIGAVDGFEVGMEVDRQGHAVGKAARAMDDSTAAAATS